MARSLDTTTGLRSISVSSATSSASRATRSNRSSSASTAAGGALVHQLGGTRLEDDGKAEASGDGRRFVGRRSALRCRGGDAVATEQLDGFLGRQPAAIGTSQQRGLDLGARAVDVDALEGG